MFCVCLVDALACWPSMVCVMHILNKRTMGGVAWFVLVYMLGKCLLWPMGMESFYMLNFSTPSLRARRMGEREKAIEVFTR